MERITTAITKISIIGLLLSTLVIQADGLDNFKLRYFSLTKHFHNQNQELDDLRKQNIDPTKNTRIDLTELLDGGPPKDGIPSIDNPRFDTAENTPFDRDELVIGVVINGEAKAYPFGILNWHEIVNDTVGGTNLTVSYCPLCDTAVVFERGNTTYGVSGKLYQSCLIMYDRADDTLYSQPWAIGIIGPKNNRSLNRLPGVKTTLGAWLAKHPSSKILSTVTGYKRDYLRYPYGSYYTNNEILFPVRNQNQRQLHPKAIINYVWEPDHLTLKNRFSGVSHQFSHQELEKVGTKVVDFNGRKIKAIWDKELKTVIVEEIDGKPIPSSTAFAFVYPAFF
ncbi:DUF3179 domain-containing protein [Gloeocapsopsis crepidinum LEGE 06123]|uniref:DUF3179 domain-containing protein n=2 Tax=Gloeocapsopsis crepidinum TaxID=693223 RepID=A0ABR9UWH3_9CHRO|nr:DUF3179 domain-containing protein [Gloeocapsopsis crepidinum]MBE9192388.1 DUF3179 domain-containing protein [Gloeocapsopsis crepidinum LEGE 06123]